MTTHEAHHRIRNAIKLVIAMAESASPGKRHPLSLITVITARHECSTIETNGRELRYNPEFVRKVDPTCLLWVLKHEGRHVTHRTNARYRRLAGKLSNRNCQEMFNHASDMEINEALMREDGWAPEFAIMPEEGEYERYPKGFKAEHYFLMMISEILFGKPALVKQEQRK